MSEEKNEQRPQIRWQLKHEGEVPFSGTNSSSDRGVEEFQKQSPLDPLADMRVMEKALLENS